MLKGGYIVEIGLAKCLMYDLNLLRRLTLIKSSRAISFVSSLKIVVSGFDDPDHGDAAGP
jgi:hypothetical protein